MKQARSTFVLLVTAGAVFFLSSVCASGPVMVEKNLFAQDRKPPGPETAPPPQQSNAPGLSAKSVQLDGVFIHGHTKKAIVRFKGGQPGQAGRGKEKGGKSDSPFKTVQEGERLGDYLVKKIESRSISLEKDGQVVVVSLFAEGKVVPPPPPVPTSPAGPGMQGGDANRQRGGQPPQPGGQRNRRAEGDLPDPNARHAGRMPPQRDPGMQPDDVAEDYPLEDETMDEEPPVE